MTPNNNNNNNNNDNRKSDLLWLRDQCLIMAKTPEGQLYSPYAGDRSKLSIFEKQTCKRWKSMMEMERMKHPLRQRRRRLLIQPITHHRGNAVLEDEAMAVVHVAAATATVVPLGRRGKKVATTTTAKTAVEAAATTTAAATPAVEAAETTMTTTTTTTAAAKTAVEAAATTTAMTTTTTTAATELGYDHTHISQKVLDLLRDFCAAYFSEMEVRLSPSFDLSEIPRLTSRVHPSTNRRQYLVDDIIRFLGAKKLRKAYCVLGVTTVDLYPGPEWNFVLGQAHMGKGSGVFSFGRYFNNNDNNNNNNNDDVSSDTIVSPAASERTEGRGQEEGSRESHSAEEQEGCGRREEGRRGAEGGCGQEEGSRKSDAESRLQREQLGNLWVLTRVRTGHAPNHAPNQLYCSIMPWQPVGPDKGKDRSRPHSRPQSIILQYYALATCGS